MFRPAGYFVPCSNPTGRIIHASTSAPSGATAVNGSGTAGVTSERNPALTSVIAWSPTWISEGEAGVVAAYASVPFATSNAVTQPSRSTSGFGGIEPSAFARYRTTRPRSSTAKTTSAPSQAGSRIAGYGPHVRSSSSVRIELVFEVTS